MGGREDVTLGYELGKKKKKTEEEEEPGWVSLHGRGGKKN